MIAEVERRRGGRGVVAGGKAEDQALLAEVGEDVGAEAAAAGGAVAGSRGVAEAAPPAPLDEDVDALPPEEEPVPPLPEVDPAPDPAPELAPDPAPELAPLPDPDPLDTLRARRAARRATARNGDRADKQHRCQAGSHRARFSPHESRVAANCKPEKQRKFDIGRQACAKVGSAMRWLIAPMLRCGLRRDGVACASAPRRQPRHPRRRPRRRPRTRERGRSGQRVRPLRGRERAARRGGDEPARRRVRRVHRRPRAVHGDAACRAAPSSSSRVPTSRSRSQSACSTIH